MTQENTFSVREGQPGEDVYINEPAWQVDMQITQDLVDDSALIVYETHENSRPTIKITVKNGYGLYEVVNFDAVSQMYTCRLLDGQVYI